ncbi:MAG: hypothetical protein U9R66_12090, partial [Thermodesulfobacteriota bacterium]|nr:hypothetical protein [Thermodesulfobacteriota bacterium]
MPPPSIFISQGLDFRGVAGDALLVFPFSGLRASFDFRATGREPDKNDSNTVTDSTIFASKDTTDKAAAAWQTQADIYDEDGAGGKDK